MTGFTADSAPSSPSSRLPSAHAAHHGEGPAGPTTLDPVGGKRGRISVVLHKTELVAFGIGHDDDYALVIIVSFAGGSSTQAGNEIDGLVDVVDGHVEMDAGPSLPSAREPAGRPAAAGDRRDAPGRPSRPATAPARDRALCSRNARCAAGPRSRWSLPTRSSPRTPPYGRAKMSRRRPRPAEFRADRGR